MPAVEAGMGGDHTDDERIARWKENELIDSFDEELEMELDDERLGRLFLHRGLLPGQAPRSRKARRRGRDAGGVGSEKIPFLSGMQ
jgi:hypothetical protein